MLIMIYNGEKYATVDLKEPQTQSRVAAAKNEGPAAAVSHCREGNEYKLPAV